MRSFKIISALFVVGLISIYAYYQPNQNHRAKDSKLSFASVAPIKTETVAEVIPPQRVHPVRIGGDVFFAGEQVPLNDLDVRERFDRELMVNTFWHSNTLLNFKLANKYFEIIDKILIEEGIPLDFRYLAVAESGLRNIKSPAGASGVWQIMSATGKSYGLNITSEIDERYHLEKATKVACDYLNEAKKKFGSWALAAASYNVGMPRLQKRLNEQQVDNYYDLYLNTETGRYMYRILAYKMVFENPHKFGLFLEEEDLYEPIQYETINIGGSIEDLAAFAKAKNTTYKMLKVANPWLRDKKLTVKEGQVFTIKIQKTMLIKPIQNLTLVLIIAISAIFTSCTFTEKVYVENDGSGTYEMDMDMSGILSFANGFAEGIENDSTESKSEKIPELMDTIIYFNDVIEQSKEIDTLSVEDKKAIESLKDGKMKMHVDEANGEMIMTFIYDFKTIDDLKNIQGKAAKAYSITNKGKDEVDPSSSSSPNKIEYSYTGKVFKRTVTSVTQTKAEKEEYEKSMQGMAMFLAGSFYKMEYHFPNKIKKHTAKNASLSKDKKTLYISYPFSEVLEDESLLDFQVKF